MSSDKYKITIKQGATFTLSMTYKNSDATPFDLTGYSARMMVRHKYTDEEPLLSASTTNGKITLGGSQGTIQVQFPASETAALTDKWGVYDLEIESPGGIVSRILEGSAVITPEATK